MKPRTGPRLRSLRALLLAGWVASSILPTAAQPAPDAPSRGPMPGQRGPWNQDLHVVAVDNSGSAEQLATFPRAGVGTLTRLKDGRLMAAHQNFPSNSPPDFDKVAVRFSSDEGRAWTAPATIRLEGLPAGYRFPFDPTLVVLPDARIRLYFTSLKGRRFNEDRPAIYSAISTNGLDYRVEPGQRFGVEGRPVIDCAVALHRGVFHLMAPDNGVRLAEPGNPGEPPPQPAGGEQAYHAISTNGLDFTRVEDVRLEGTGNWLGNLMSEGEQLWFAGTGRRGAPGKPGGGLWLASSRDGSRWVLSGLRPFVPGADPGIARLKDGRLLFLVTGPPRMGTPGAPMTPRQPGPGPTPGRPGRFDRPPPRQAPPPIQGADPNRP